ncbi:hypothetical protein LCGC14_0437440 [marine sediment metagenome]|uniref:Uncharacterized protein n=1 Tax=marine sediment metagenome TaxID=412755 RepID=A0A0F9VVQ7_9ZZZZ
MRTRNKRSNKLDKPIPGIAQSFADRFIASYGIKNAEQVAKLVYEKVVASRKSLERRYGK